MKLILEIFVCACEKAGIIRYANFNYDITDRKCDPDIILSEELTRIGIRPNETCHYAHSTSWRYETGKTVLTYLVWSTLDQLALFHTHILAPDISGLPCAADRLKPRPAEINEASVLSHGLRHLRFLIDRKDAVIFDTNFKDDIAATVGQLEPAVAGRISYDEILMKKPRFL
jgi:hypothetical protein